MKGESKSYEKDFRTNGIIFWDLGKKSVDPDQMPQNAGSTLFTYWNFYQIEKKKEKVQQTFLKLEMVSSN